MNCEENAWGGVKRRCQLRQCGPPQTHRGWLLPPPRQPHLPTSGAEPIRLGGHQTPCPRYSLLGLPARSGQRSARRALLKAWSSRGQPLLLGSGNGNARAHDARERCAHDALPIADAVAVRSRETPRAQCAGRRRRARVGVLLWHTAGRWFRGSRMYSVRVRLRERLSDAAYDGPAV